MRLLHLADTHLGAHLPAWGAPRGWHRSQDHERAWARALAPAREERVDAVIHAGDLFDRRDPNPGLVRHVGDTLADVARRIPVFLIPGNHDTPRLRRLFPLLPPGLVVADEPTRVRLEDVAIGLVPYARRPEPWLDLLPAAVGPGVDLLVAHQQVDGAMVPGFTFRTGRPPGTLGPEHMPPRVSWVLGGHLHPRQVVRVGSTRWVFPGSTERTAFSEEDETKGIALWTLEDGVRWQFQDLPSRPMRYVRTPEDLFRLEAETLVRIADVADYDDLFHAAREAGAWVNGHRPGTRRSRPVTGEQLRLFAR